MRGLRKIGKFFSDFADKIRNSISRKHQRPDGKFMDENILTYLIKYGLPALIIISLTYAVITSKQDYQAFSTLKKERTPKVEVGESITTSLTAGNDLEREKNTQDILKLVNSGKSDSVDLGNTYSSKGSKPNKFECKELLEKMKRGDALEGEELQKGRSCLEDNTLGLSPEQKLALEGALDPNIPPEARKGLAEYALEPNPSPLDPRASFAKGLQGTPDQRAAALTGFANKNLTEKEKEALANAARGVSSDPALVKTLVDKNLPKSGNQDTTKNLTPEISGSGSSLSSLADTISKLESLLKGLLQRNNELKDEIKNKAQTNPDAVGPVANELNNNNRAIAEKEKELESAKVRFNEIYKENKMEILKAQKIAKGEDISGIRTIEIEDDIPEFIPKKSNQKKLTTDELKIIDLLNSLKKKPRKSNDLAQYGDIKFETDATQVVVNGVYKTTGLKLPGNAKIQAVSETVISISEANSSNFPVQLRVLADVMGTEGIRPVIYKNAIISCKTAGFDTETEIVSIACTRLTIGPETQDVAFSVQLKGKVIDTRGKTITAAVGVDAVASITEKIIKDAQSNVSSENASLNEIASLAGVTMGANAMQKVANILAQDLQSAKKVFYAPPGIPVVIYP